jgi:hypothetical protein
MSAPVETTQEVSEDLPQVDQPAGEESSSQLQQEIVSDFQEQVEEALSEGATPKQVQQMLKEFELKVNGKSVKKSIDLSNEEEVRKELQKAAAFGDLSQTHAQMVKNLQAKINAWKSNPDLLFQDLEMDPLDYAEKRIQKEVDELKKTPEEKKYEEQQRKLMEYEEKERKLQEQLAQQQAEKENQQAYEALRSEIKDAFEGHPGLKYTEKTERKVADMMARYSEKFPDITASQVIPLVEKEMKEEMNEYLDSMPEEFLAKFLNQNVIDKIAKKVAKPAPKVPAKKAPPVTSTQVVAPSANSVKQNQQIQNSKPKKSFEDVWR